MKHIYRISESKELPLMADEKYVPNFLPNGYIEGIISGGGGFKEVANAILYDQAMGLVKKIV